jgi:predicted esterase
MNLSPERKFTEQEKSARIQLNYALSQHMQGNQSGALKALRQALTLDPNLAQEKVVINLAQHLTGLPAPEALKSLANAGESKNLIESARKQDHRTMPAKKQQLPSAAFFVLILLVIFLIGLTIMGVTSGRVSMSQLTVLQYFGKRFDSGGYEYYAIPPSGSPPADGWNVVVALHGYNGKGANMLSLAKNFTDAGAVFVSPTFGEYAPNPGDGPIEPMSRILNEVAAKYPVRSRGAVLLGLSQGGMFAYRFSVYHPEQVYGVVTAGSPGFDPIYPSNPAMPYVFSWGELDGLQNFVVPENVQPLQVAGYNVAVYIIPGYGHEMTPFAIEQTLNMIR